MSGCHRPLAKWESEQCDALQRQTPGIVLASESAEIAVLFLFADVENRCRGSAQFRLEGAIGGRYESYDCTNGGSLVAKRERIRAVLGPDHFPKVMKSAQNSARHSFSMPRKIRPTSPKAKNGTNFNVLCYSMPSECARVRTD